MRPLLASLVLAFAPLAVTAQRPADPLAGFDAYAERARRDWQVPGMAVVVVQGDSVRLVKGYGVRELGKPDAVGVHTRFGAMSTTKAFTAMLAAMLADSGQLGLDDRVVDRVPGFQLADPYGARATCRFGIVASA